MATISLNDIIFATATFRGSEIVSLSLSGLTSLSELLAELRRRIGTTVKGLVTVSLRNRSQGWSQTRALYMNASATEGVQLSLF